jgi:hypothetical protein
MSRSFALAALLLAGVGLACAATAEFSALPAAQQRLLASAEALWPALPAAERASLRRRADDWLARSRAQRQSLLAAWRQWRTAPPSERARRRAAAAAWRVLTPNEQQTLRNAQAAFSALPGARQHALRLAFAQLPADRQLAWRLGPRLGRDLPALAPLFVYVPETQREPLLALLRDLDEGARADLAVLAARLPETRRQSLREHLLATAPAERGEIIRAALAAQ